MRRARPRRAERAEERKRIYDTTGLLIAAFLLACVCPAPAASSSPTSPSSSSPSPPSIDMSSSPPAPPAASAAGGPSPPTSAPAASAAGGPAPPASAPPAPPAARGGCQLGGEPAGSRSARPARRPASAHEVLCRLDVRGQDARNCGGGRLVDAPPLRQRLGAERCAVSRLVCLSLLPHPQSGSALLHVTRCCSCRLRLCSLRLRAWRRRRGAASARPGAGSSTTFESLTYGVVASSASWSLSGSGTAAALPFREASAGAALASRGDSPPGTPEAAAAAPDAVRRCCASPASVPLSPTPSPCAGGGMAPRQAPRLVAATLRDTFGARSARARALWGSRAGTHLPRALPADPP